MTKAKTGKTRAAAHAVRMSEAGKVKVSFSKWVPSEKENRIRAAIGQAVERELLREL